MFEFKKEWASKVRDLDVDEFESLWKCASQHFDDIIPVCQEEKVHEAYSFFTGLKVSKQETMFAIIFALWISYRETEKRKKFKTDNTMIRAYRSLIKMSNADPEVAKRIVERSIENTYQGLFPLPTNGNTSYALRRESEGQQALADYFSQAIAPISLPNI